jgi:hypothetical protein
LGEICDGSERMSRSKKVVDTDPDILWKQQIHQAETEADRAYTDEQSKWHGVADFAARDGRFYAPATEDLWFKFAMGSDGGRVSSAFIKAVVALSFRHCNTEVLGKNRQQHE